jgi:glycosyltransferase involved in cell wall biosynthesis
MRLSVIVITRNEAVNLRACLESVAFADEKIVVDNASTDATAAIARECGAAVTHTDDWPGFGIQRRTVRWRWPRVTGSCPSTPTNA